MAVAIKGELHRGVPQGLLHVGGVRALGQQQRGVGVPQVVPPYVTTFALDRVCLLMETP